MASITDCIDWVQVLMNAPVCVSLFGVGLCLRGLAADLNR